ncbi:L-type lectin-domain containing receptor kinase S.4 [Striga hermonthica]|uniref:non-specific serine/threonine protein kinase n=1 Tax=Striga hermonthica TaxID=68872 RepID=A0A9N7MPJ2_STRHE|nr:L-type lectin-domain containing receptor kinase S.4 [Striga hermonthica]
MGTRIILFLNLLIFLSISDSSHQANTGDFIFHGFNNAGTKIATDGAARVEPNGILKLTNDSPRLVGHAFYETPIQLKDGKRSFSFSTAFAFAIVPEYKKLGGHGFAFTLSKSRDLSEALPSQYLGLLNENNMGNFSSHIFAVEFDTVKDLELGDINDNHVGIDINSLISNASAKASCFDQNISEKQEIHLQSGKTIQAWIDYDANRKEIRVTLSRSSSKPAFTILSYPVELSPILKEYMYVGFSASTGLLASSHYVSGWSFKTNGQAPSLDLSLCPSIPGPNKNRLPITVVAFLLAAGLLAFTVGFSFYVAGKINNRDVVEPWELDVGPHRFSYRELKQATGGFSDNNLLGSGGFGKVYRGTLPDFKVQIAVKRISHESKQGLREFVTEIESIGRLRHRNLVSLRGWCRRKTDLLLVYDLMPNGSLDKYIRDDPGIVLSWQQRVKIVKDVANGLLYLHEEWERAVIHRDVKSGNVLLDSGMNARLGDFGLAKLHEHGSGPDTTRVVGTLGYVAPELTRSRKPSWRSDVFAYGAVVLEVVCGRRPVEVRAGPEELVLVDWVWDKWREGRVMEVVDQRLGGMFDRAQAVEVIRLGLLCSDDEPQKRPRMREVVRVLEVELTVAQTLGECGPDVLTNTP